MSTPTTPTLPPFPTTIANLPPLPNPLSGPEFIPVVQNGVTYRGTASQFAFPTSLIVPVANGGTGNATGDLSALTALSTGGTVAQTIANHFRYLLYPEDFGASTAATDNSPFLQNWLNAGSNGFALGIGWGKYKFATALVLNSAIQSLSIMGVGKTASVLEYTGANTTNDILLIGSASGASLGASIRGFGIISDTVMTGGAALHLEKVEYSFIDVQIGTPAASNLYHGIWEDTCSFNNLLASASYVNDDAWRGSNTLDTHFNHFIFQGFGTGIGIHAGGGCGGICTEQCDGFGYGKGMVIDTSIVSVGNTQFFISEESSFDSNINAGLYVNDALSGSKAIFCEGWFASTTSGSAIVIINWASGTFNSAAGKFYNSQGGGHGIIIEDGTVTPTLGTACDISANTGYGITATTSVTIYSRAIPMNNMSGPYGTDIINGLLFTNSTSGDVALNNTSTYFDGPKVSQPVTGLYDAEGTVTLWDTAGAAIFFVLLWDGSTNIDSTVVEATGSSNYVTASVSGSILNPSGNIRISVKDISSTSGAMVHNVTGTGKDSSITVKRIG